MTTLNRREQHSRVRSFDHGAFGALPEYAAAQKALSALVPVVHVPTLARFRGEGASKIRLPTKIDCRPAVVSLAHPSRSWTGPPAERTEMERPCDSCRTRYTAKSPLSRYCGSRCAKRAQRTGLSRSAVEPAVVAAVPSGAGAVEAAVRGALEAAGRLSAPLGEVALVLARRLDAPGGESGSGLASVAKQLAVTLAAVGSDVRPADDLLDDLRIRRDRKLGRLDERS
jgi:hypothetical protein